MKKSNALMISYIMILVSTIISEFCMDWNGIERVALSATIAGSFFAIADFFGWAASFELPIINAQKECIHSYKSFLQDIIDDSEKDAAEVQETMKALKPYRNSHKQINDLFEACEELRDVIVSTETLANEAYDEANTSESEIIEKEGKNNIKQYLEIAFAACGFFCFFLLLVYDWAVETLLPLNSIITVITFVIIMLNYFLKDVFEDIIKKNIEGFNAVNEKVVIRKSFYKESTKINLMKIAKEAISSIEVDQTNQIHCVEDKE